jgi:hypothetical protein
MAGSHCELVHAAQNDAILQGKMINALAAPAYYSFRMK